MKHACYFVAAILLVAFVGCEGFRYEITVVPRGHEFERTITISRTGTMEGATTQPATAPATTVQSGGEELRAEIKRIAKAYGIKAPESGTIKARFKARTPNDVGGAGFYKQYLTPMGSAYLYSERFRGDDDLSSQLEKKATAADELVDILIPWFRSEFGKDPRFEKLHGFLDKQFRRDLKNLSVYLWLNGIGCSYESITEEEMMTRAGQYLAERGYLSPDDLPALTRALMSWAIAKENEEQGITRFLSLVQRVLASKMGLSKKDPIPASLAFLSSPKSAEKSLRDYLRSTEQFKKLLREHETERKQKKTEMPESALAVPDPLGILEGPAERLFDMEFVMTNDQVDLKLIVPVKPFVTNGKWDKATGAVNWSERLAQSKDKTDAWPVVCFAYWSVPDEAFQRKRFGKIVLKDRDLMRYCILRRAFSAAESKVWEEFLVTLRPGKDLEQRLKAFREDETKAVCLRELAGQFLPFQEDENDAEQPASRPAASTRPK